ncbi:hypothetical protein GDO81_006072 [Engystomops pustulosus]|uniref:Uncharacterized protein n=1 Tax=Engystomops pustulosus TaxID=76066 RepID=A0AAV7CVL7_ENGPU|nr:hypothetical protein GDO81_006072 [Engystomops pustulosus]
MNQNLSTLENHLLKMPDPGQQHKTSASMGNLLLPTTFSIHLRGLRKSHDLGHHDIFRTSTLLQCYIVKWKGPYPYIYIDCFEKQKK